MHITKQEQRRYVHFSNKKARRKDRLKKSVKNVVLSMM